MDAFLFSFFFSGAILFMLFIIAKGLKSLFDLPTTNLKTPTHPDKSIKEVYPFKKKSYLMTQTEFKFFGVLQQILKGEYFLIPQVALSRIIEVQGGLKKYGYDSWYSNFNRINKKTVDFVIFDKIYLSPLLVIELDDYTHNFLDRQERDNFLDGALKSANLNILHIKPQYNYDTTQLEQTIFEKLNISQNSSNNTIN